MNNGGYIMVDMTGWKVGTASEIPGIYKRLSDALKTGKQIIICGASVGTVLAPFSAYVQRTNDTTISITYEGSTYHVASDDTIGS